MTDEEKRKALYSLIEGFGGSLFIAVQPSPIAHDRWHLEIVGRPDDLVKWRESLRKEGER